MEKFTKPELLDFLCDIGDYDNEGDIPNSSIDQTESLPE